MVKIYPQMTLEFLMSEARFVLGGGEPNDVATTLLKHIFERVVV